MNITTSKADGQIVVQEHASEDNDGDYPEGNFKEAWLALEKKFNPKIIKTKKDLKEEYNGMKMLYGREEKPSVFIHQMKKIREKLESGPDKALFAISDATFKIDILSRLPLSQKNGEGPPYECWN